MCVLHQSEDHLPRIIKEHQDAGQAVALRTGRNLYQHDPRHVDVLVKDFGLEHGNSVQTAAAPDAAQEEEAEPLSQDQHHKYRSQVARCLFLQP